VDWYDRLPNPKTALAYMVWAARIARICLAAIESGGMEALRELQAGPSSVSKKAMADAPPPSDVS